MYFVWFSVQTAIISVNNINQLIFTVSIIRALTLMMEAVSTSETSVSFYQATRRNITEDRPLHTRRPENLKSHIISPYSSGETVRPLRIVPPSFAIRGWFGVCISARDIEAVGGNTFVILTNRIWKPGLKRQTFCLLVLGRCRLRAPRSFGSLRPNILVIWPSSQQMRQSHEVLNLQGFVCELLPLAGGLPRPSVHLMPCQATTTQTVHLIRRTFIRIFYQRNRTTFNVLAYFMLRNAVITDLQINLISSL
jgi:hypothetical protein